MLARIRSFLSALVRRGRFEADMDRELRFHIEAQAADLARAGVPRDEALRRARAAFGGVEGVKEECRQGRGLRLADELRQDLTYAARTMAKAPSFTAAVVASLALGIGATTTIFTLMEAVLFRSLPVDAPRDLYLLAHDPGERMSTSSNYPLFERYRSISAFSGVTAFRGQTFRVMTPDGAERVAGQYVSGNFHAVVRAPIVLGRGFAAEPDRRSGATLAAVISHDYWTSRFGRSPDVIGRTLIVDDRVVTVIGVTGPGFQGLMPGQRADITLPISVFALGEPEFLDAHDGWIGLVIVGRLAPGVDSTQALAAVDVAFQRFLAEPRNEWVRKMSPDHFRTAALIPAASDAWGIRRQYAKPLWVLMGMVAVLLLIACANVANLLLARATARTREIAVRVSIGAGRARLLRQLLTESLLLSAFGAACGLVLAYWGTGAIVSLIAAGPSPAVIEASVNTTVLLFTIAVALTAGVAFGLAPALRSTRVELSPALKDGVVTTTPSHRAAAGKTLVAAQVALSVLIVAAAALLARSVGNLQRLDAGFDRQRIVMADVETAGEALTPEARMRLYGELLERLRSRPGVEAASLSSRTPIDLSAQLRRIEVPGVPVLPGQGVSTNVVTPGYFATFGLDVVRGRGLTDADGAGAMRVAVVSASMARFYFGNRDALGRTFVLGRDTARPTTIVGVVSDARHERLRTEAPPKMVYLPLAQAVTDLDGRLPTLTMLTVALRTREEAAAIGSTVRQEVRALSRDMLVPYLRTMEQQVDATLVPERLLARLSTSFAAAAVLLAAVGLYGVMTYGVSRRTREIGIRIALGAVPRAVLRHVLREALVVSAVGVLLGVPLALAATGVLSAFLFGVTPHDPATLLGTVVVLLAVAVLAALPPARHAAAVDPIRALRAD